jgi:hypothetical protein
MTTTANIGNTYLIPKVILSPITDDQSGVLDNNLEPPFVRVRGRNSCFTFLDTFAREERISNSSYLISNPSGILAKRTKRFSISYLSAFMPTPNINPRNNAITFATGAGTFTVTIPEGFYTRTQAIAALLVALNTVSGPSGVTFTAPNQFPNSNLYITLTGTNPFRIQSNTFVTTGSVFWGFLPGDPRLSSSAALSTTLTIGPITALYTRYWDFVSRELLQHTKAANTGSDVPANTLFRAFLEPNADADPTSYHRVSFQINGENSAWNFDASHALATVDIQILDEFRQPYYLPNGTDCAAGLQLSLNNEL